MYLKLIVNNIYLFYKYLCSCMSTKNVYYIYIENNSNFYFRERNRDIMKYIFFCYSIYG